MVQQTELMVIHYPPHPELSGAGVLCVHPTHLHTLTFMIEYTNNVYFSTNLVLIDLHERGIRI